MKTRLHFIILHNLIPFVFVVPPKDLQVTCGQLTESINIIDFGEKIQLGEKKADKISFSTFLPHINSHFYDPLKNPLPPIAGVELLKYWKKNKYQVKFIIPELGIYYVAKIENVTANVTDLTKDIDISISLVEDRQQKVITDNVAGLFQRFL